jgi:hypothetical protein
METFRKFEKLPHPLTKKERQTPSGGHPSNSNKDHPAGNFCEKRETAQPETRGKQ